MEISPGLAQAGFELLHLIGRQGLTIEVMLGGLKRIGPMPAADALGLAQTLNWIGVDASGIVVATDEGRRILELAAYPAMLRQTLLDHAAILSPPWLQNARDGRTRSIAFAPIGARQMMIEAGLAEGVSEDIVAFWDHLASLARGQRDERLTAIGRIGEQLTLVFEKERTGRSANWVAIDSNADGYDVLSIIAAENPAPLAIEVKTTSVGLSGTLFLTRNEWRKAKTSPAYSFHLWDISRSTQPALASVGIDAMAAHVPVDEGEGSWSEAAIPFAAFAELFRCP